MPPSLPRLAVALASIISLAGCAAPPSPPAVPPVAGVWRTQGYGMVLDVHGDSLTTYEITTTTCLPALTARRVAGSDSSAPVFQGEGENSRTAITLRPGEGGTRRVVRPGTASDIVIEPIPALPVACSHPTPDTPLSNFEVFTRTWAEQYILFDQKGVDWEAAVAQAKVSITDSTPPDQLFTVLQSLIEPFHDAHTSIVAPALNRRFFAFRPGVERFMAGGFEAFRDREIPRITAVTNRYLQAAPRRFCNDKVQYGLLNDSTGYLRILSFSGYADGPYDANLAALETALDTVMTDLAGRKRLVIDVRINTGGADPLGLAIASRLATQEYVAYTKQARADPADRTQWTPGQPSVVRPSTRPSFPGEVVELTGPLTISAGETFTQALMGRTPKVLRIGANTQGVFSDVLGRRLPNGWRFGLPNEVFRNAEGTTYDGPGIPPDVMVPVFPESDLRAGRDGALERALGRTG